MSGRDLSRCLSRRGLSTDTRKHVVKVRDESGKVLFSTHIRHGRSNEKVTFESKLAEALNRSESRSPRRKEEAPAQEIKERLPESTELQ